MKKTDRLRRDVFALPLLASAVLACFAAPASADEGVVIVTGTRQATRTALDSSSPIDVLSAEDLKKSGATDLNSVLARLLPSFNFPRPSVTDTSDAVKPAQLRGLSPDHTLVLVNGKRRHTTAILNTNGTQGRGSAPVDLNAIPLEAVERIEVLRDGAAALYGSDAIAGVINVILKKSSGGEATVGLGQYGEGDGKRSSAGIHGGIALADQGWLHLSASWRDQGYTNRAGADWRNSAEPRYGQVNQRYGEPDSTQGAFFANGQLNLPGGAELYAFGGYTGLSTQSAGFWRPALDSRNIPAIYPEGFLPLESSNSEDQSLVVGLRGALGDGWRWDTSLNYGRNRFRLDVDNSLNTSLGATSPRSFYIGTLSNGETLFNADLARDFSPSWLQGPLSLALGAEARSERYEIGAGDPSSYFGTGAQVFAGFRPSDSGSHSRSSDAIYLNLEADITKALSASLALRGEHYSDFGSATSAKLSGRYAISPKAALRGTASTGFRAPSLAQQFYSTTTTGFIGGVPYDVRTFAVSDPVAKQLGAEDLKAEKSRNLSLGLVLQPLRDVTASLDAYQIDIDDRIVLSENLTGTAVRSFLAANGYSGVDGGRYFTNAVDTRTRGVDLVGTWHLDLGGAGTTDLSLGYNHTHTDIRAIAANPEQLSSNGLSLTRIGRVEQGRITKGSPSDKLSLGADYRRAAWTLHGQLTRYGEFTVYNANPAQDQTFSANWVLDLAATYRLDRISITGGVDNLSDRYPNPVIAPNSNSGILPYSNSSPYGFSGRFFYAKLGYRW